MHDAECKPSAGVVASAGGGTGKCLVRNQPLVQAVLTHFVMPLLVGLILALVAWALANEDPPAPVVVVVVVPGPDRSGHCAGLLAGPPARVVAADPIALALTERDQDLPSRSRRASRATMVTGLVTDAAPLRTTLRQGTMRAPASDLR
jgi:hypothetical protein